MSGAQSIAVGRSRLLQCVAVLALTSTAAFELISATSARVPRTPKMALSGTIQSVPEETGPTSNVCCETIWGPRSPEECCQNCQSSAFGFECVAWEWYEAGADCYVCSKEVFKQRGEMAGDRPYHRLSPDLMLIPEMRQPLHSALATKSGSACRDSCQLNPNMLKRVAAAGGSASLAG
jgi:hypothetical protein